MAGLNSVSSGVPAAYTSAQKAATNGPGANPPPPPALPAGQPRMIALGLDGLIALLSEEGAKQMRKDARENQRAERDSQLAAIGRQVHELREKASALRREAALTAGLTITGGAAQFIGAGSTGGAGLKLAVGGKAVSDSAGPVGKWAFGGQQIEHEAEATRAASDAKRAESAADEYASLMKSADSTIDKAHQALQQLAQMRAQLLQTHGVYRPM